MSDKDSLFYFQDGLKDWAKTGLIGGVFKHLTTPSPLRNCSLNTPPNPKTKRPTKAKVGERVARTRATTTKIGGRKSRLGTRAGKEARRARRRHRNHAAHALYAMVLIGYATFRRRSRLMLSQPNQRATLICLRRSPNSAWVLSNVLAHSTANSPHSSRKGSCM